MQLALLYQTEFIFHYLIWKIIRNHSIIPSLPWQAAIFLQAVGNLNVLVGFLLDL